MMGYAMRILTIVCLILLAACTRSQIQPGVRQAFLGLNLTMNELCDRAKIECDKVNIGKVEGDGTGDPLAVAVGKIDLNLLRLRPHMQKSLCTKPGPIGIVSEFELRDSIT